MIYKTVLPSGVLTTRAGKEYWLIVPHPITKDWEQDRQQRFLVVPKDPIDNDGNEDLHSYQRHLITTDPDIEYRYLSQPIKVWDLQEKDISLEEPILPTDEEDEPIPADVLKTLEEMEIDFT